MEKNSIFFEIFFDHFYGQSFIKTVRGPLNLKELRDFFHL